MFSTWHGYEDFKDLPRRTASDKILRDKVFNIAKNLKYKKKILKYEKVSGGAIKNENMSNKKLAELYTKQLLENSRKEKYSYFIDNI